MLSAFTGDAVREAEASLLARGHGARLMAQAAYGLAIAVARSLRGKVYGQSIAILVGPGNNGGDALYAGAFLARRGAWVRAVLVAPRVHEGGLSAFRAAGGAVCFLNRDAGAAFKIAQNARIVIDGILGMGASGGIDDRRLPGAAALMAALEHHAGIIACDIPSGVEATSGRVTGPVLSASATVTFGAVKTGLLLPPGNQYVGRLSCVALDLSLGGPQLCRLQTQDLHRLWPRPKLHDYKYTRGVARIVAGSARYPGAARLSVAGALAAGVGMVRYTGPNDIPLPPEVIRDRSEEGEASADSEADLDARPVQSWVLGPGIDADPHQRRACARAFADAAAREVALVVDAGALALFPQMLEGLPKNSARNKWLARCLLTPHNGELAALLTSLGQKTSVREIEEEPVTFARLAATLTRATVLLKGATTLIIAQDEEYCQAEGTPWLATAGSGDVLAGIAGALLASGLSLPVAGALAASLHGRAGRLAALGTSSKERSRASANAGNPVYPDNPVDLVSPGPMGMALGGPISADRLAKMLPEAIAELSVLPEGSAG